MIDGSGNVICFWKELTNKRQLLFTFSLTDAEGAKVMKVLRNDALKELFKRLTINKLTFFAAFSPYKQQR